MLGTKTATHLLKALQKYCACHKTIFDAFGRHMKMPGSAMPATHAAQNHITTGLDTFKRMGLAASPIDTAKPQENQRVETKHVGATKRVLHARRPQIFIHRSSKSTVSYEFSYGPTSKSMFRARLPSFFMTGHKMPRLPRTLHVVTTSRSVDNAIRNKIGTRRLKCCACHVN